MSDHIWADHEGKPYAAKITVYDACLCDTCQNPKARWYQCPNVSKRWIASYDCEPRFCDMSLFPSDAAIRDVEAKHPGCVLVYAKP